MSVEIVTGYKCSDGSVYANKKAADDAEVRLNVKTFIDDHTSDVRGLTDDDREFVLDLIVSNRNDLRDALNGTYDYKKKISNVLEINADAKDNGHGY